MFAPRIKKKKTYESTLISPFMALVQKYTHKDRDENFNQYETIPHMEIIVEVTISPVRRYSTVIL